MAKPSHKKSPIKGNSKKSGSLLSSSSIKKSKPLSKKKQKALSKSSEAMIDKMNHHITDEDIFNIAQSVDNGLDTKETEDEQKEKSSQTGLAGLKAIKKDYEQDLTSQKKTEEQVKKTNDELADQMKLIDSFIL